VSAAAAFILGRQARDGTWRDFRTLAGEGEDWTTAYVGSQLSTARVSASSLRRATNALLARQRADGGWGYNALVPTDGDSTAWALLFLARRTRRRAALAAGVRCVLAHQDPDTGGVGTYANPASILRYMGLPSSVSLAGWRQPQVEVTAVAGRALATLRDVPAAAVPAAWQFVREHQGDDGRWHSYWWTTPLYATFQAVAFACSRPDLPGARSAVRRAMRWVIDTQRADGGWAPRSTTSTRAFDTALALAIMSLGAPSRGSRDVIARAVTCLCGMQLASGRWPSAPILRIPPPGITKPDQYRRWRIEELGTGVVVPDHNGLFTTATVVGALAFARRILAVWSAPLLTPTDPRINGWLWQVRDR
jgi:squalene cyclase